MSEAVDPLLRMTVEVHFVQPFAATKTYLCPGCSHEITPRTGHYVTIPHESPDLRRHWHRHCWERRDRIRPGRR